MYIPPLHRFDDEPEMTQWIVDRPLGTWVCAVDGGLSAHHVPFLLDRTRGPHGTLIGHVARGNPVWRRLHPDAPSVVSFIGPQAYVTPTWYPGHAANGEVVPTWNYVAVHAHGTARAVHDPAWLIAMLEALTHAHEAARPEGWRLADAPPPYLAQMLAAIVGIEIPIDRLEGRLKASQDEAPEDQWGTAVGLREEPGDEARAMGEVVAREAARRRGARSPGEDGG